MEFPQEIKKLFCVFIIYVCVERETGMKGQGDMWLHVSSFGKKIDMNSLTFVNVGKNCTLIFFFYVFYF